VVRIFRRRIGRVGAELALLAASGLLMGILGPYQSGTGVPVATRYLYWMICLMGGGAIGIALDETLGRRLQSLPLRVLVIGVTTTPPVALFVGMVGNAMVGDWMRSHDRILLGWQVFAICLPVATVRALTWRAPRTVIETRTVVTPPLPEAEAVFRTRLSAKRRGARLLAIEAEDHYLRVHTDAGEELLSVRFADALAELAGAHGFKTHRSWWIAADAIEAVHWRRGGGEARMAGGLVVPVSRSQAPLLKAAGWF